jgi:hypothetical protein
MRVAARDVVEVTGRGEAVHALVRVAGADRSAASVRDPVDSEAVVAAVVRRHVRGLPVGAASSALLTNLDYARTKIDATPECSTR